MKKRNSLFNIISAAALLFAFSCAGPYKAKVVNQPTEKLEIADGLFNRGKYQDAIVEYKDYLAVFAGDERSDYAQFKLAEAYRLDENYPLAAVEYRILINDYGYSEYVDDAFYLESLCYYKQARRVERDQTKTFEARSRIIRFLRLFPNSPRMDEAKELLAEINDKLADKKFMAAKLYFSLEHYNAASIYFRNVVDEYPDTRWAVKSHYYLGRILEESGKIERAADEYRMVTSSSSNVEEKDKAAKRLERISGNVKEDG